MTSKITLTILLFCASHLTVFGQQVADETVPVLDTYVALETSGSCHLFCFTCRAGGGGTFPVS